MYSNMKLKQYLAVFMIIEMCLLKKSHFVCVCVGGGGVVVVLCQLYSTVLICSSTSIYDKHETFSVHDQCMKCNSLLTT